MLKDITLGQFFPGESVLHRADPRMKVIISIMYIVMVFLAQGISAYIFVAGFTVVSVIVSGIKPKVILKSLKPIVLIIIITTLLNIILTKGDILLVKWYFIEIYAEGLIFAGAMALRIVSLITGLGAILTYTTSPIAITDGLEQLLSPLKKIKIPVHEFTMMMTIAMRFIPTLLEETEKIMNAQKARGTDFSTGGPMKRVKSFVPVLIPLFISSFRRAEELATAMECRCYHGGDGRTRMNILHFSPMDFIMLGVFALSIAAVVLLNIFFPIWVK